MLDRLIHARRGRSSSVRSTGVLDTSSPTRDPTLDIIRGGCVVTMTFAHLATYTWPSWLLHLPRWVDGASGFVLLAGLVLGMVQQGRLRRGGMSGAQRSLWYRVAMLYAWHVAIVLLALVIGASTATTISWLPDPALEGGLARAAFRTLLLQVNPPYLDILPLYVVLLTFASGALLLLVQGRIRTLCAASLALYALGQLVPGLTTFPGVNGSWSQFNWGTWQLLFLSGLVVGYHWKSLERRLSSPRALWFAGATVCSVYVLLVPVIYFGILPDAYAGATWFLAKGSAGPGWIAMAWASFVIAAQLVRLGLRLVPHGWWLPLSMIGRRSLDSYVLMTLLLIVVPVVAGRVLDGNAAILLALGALTAMCAWVMLRDRVARWRSTSSVVFADRSA